MKQITETQDTKNYVSPECEIIIMDVPEILCWSGPTENVDDIEGEW